MINNRFICPIPGWLRGELLEYNRLYAFPVFPEILGNSEIMILDSGGYSFMKQNRKMSYSYIEKLAEHYSKYETQNVFCAAPDIGGNMWETMKNYEYYLKNFGNNIQPVFQYSKPTIDLFEIQYQCDFYKEKMNNKQFIFSGKGRSNVELMKKHGFKHKLDFIQNKLNVWIHIFGIGWGIHDISELAKMGKLFSVDTINYYQSAENIQRNANEWNNYEKNKVKAAIINAQRANQLLK